jgi:hypothetical protein
LPILWYRYPVPNEIREFWYKERPDILNYMQKAYKDLDIQFFPDSLVKELHQQTDLSSTSTSFLLPESLRNHALPSTNHFIQTLNDFAWEKFFSS